MPKNEVNPNMFRAYDIRGIAGNDLVPGIAEIIGKAVGTFLRSRSDGTQIAVGMDNRLSSEDLKNAFVQGLISVGSDVIDIGLASSPVMYEAVINGGYIGGVNVTASHNPKQYNGFKIVRERAYPVAGDEITIIRDLAINGHFEAGAGSKRILDTESRYLKKIQDAVRLNRGLEVVLDTGNGVAGKFAPILLKRLGNRVLELHCELDGNFPNHDPNPENESNVIDVEEMVRTAKADIGIAIDGDGDRLGVIDEKGSYVVADNITILLARDFLQRHLGAEILVDVKSSMNVINEIQKHGGIPVLYKTGHSLIKQKMRDDNIMLGGEFSGHFYVFENYYPFDDALYAASKVLEILSKSTKPLSEHFADLPVLYSTRLIEIPCDDAAKFDVIDKAVRIFSQTHEVNTIDGARITFSDGWAIIRASNTTPTLTFRAEADSPEALEKIKLSVFDVLGQFPAVRLASTE